MKAITVSLWWAACATAIAAPGGLDKDFHPELRAWVTPENVTRDAAGRIWIGGGFDRADRWSTGDLVRLGENGGVAAEPARGYLNPFSGLVLSNEFPAPSAPFHLADGSYLLPGAAGTWLRVEASGRIGGNAFPDSLPGQTIAPQFERNSKLWVIRRLEDGRRVLEARHVSGGSLDAGFQTTAGRIEDAVSAVPTPDGGVWLLAGGAAFPLGFAGVPDVRVVRLDAAGNILTESNIPGNAYAFRLQAGPAGSFRILSNPSTGLWGYWPVPETATYRIEWRSPDGLLERRRDFRIAPSQRFCWAEAADGSFLAMDATARSASGAVLASGTPAVLRRFTADGAPDPSFQSPGEASSVLALPDGGWLIDGLRRLRADGVEDGSWIIPEVSRPASVRTVAELPDGSVLAGGDFGTVNGSVKNRLVLFRPDGTADPAFVPDERIGEWRSLAVSGGAVYVVTERPAAYGAGSVSNLVKLRRDGSIDEAFAPRAAAPFPSLMMSEAVRVHAIGNGDILVVTYSRSEVMTERVARLRPDGSADPAFRPVVSFNGPAGLIALANGGFVKGGTFHRADGTVKLDLTTANTGLRPLCELPRGVLFLETRDGPEIRLRLWTPRGWSPTFRGPALNAGTEVLACPGPAGTVFLAADIKSRGLSLVRLTPDGALDRGFAPQGFASRARREPGGWWTVGQTGRKPFSPVRNEIATLPQALCWQARGGFLWAGGAFNMATGRPRDGIARFTAGFSAKP